MTHADITQRYPRLLRLIAWKASLSLGEAIACIRDYKDGFEYSSEAVNHYGGTSAVIRDAAAFRHIIARLQKGY